MEPFAAWYASARDLNKMQAATSSRCREECCVWGTEGKLKTTRAAELWKRCRVTVVYRRDDNSLDQSLCRILAHAKFCTN